MTDELFTTWFEIKIIAFLAYSAGVNSIKPAEYIRPNITQKMKYDAEKSARQLITKYGYNNINKIVGALAVENMRLVAEINEHRAAVALIRCRFMRCRDEEKNYKHYPVGVGECRIGIHNYWMGRW